MSKAKITLLGFYNWDSTLFDSIQLTPLINKETLINNILLECGEFEVLYGDPTFYKNAVNHFFTLNYDLFNRWATDLELEYNPLENYDRMENWTDSSENQASESEHTSTSMTNSATNTSNSTDTISSNSLDEKSAFDNNTLVADTKNTFASSDTNNTSGTNSSNASGTGNRGTTTNNSSESEHEGRIHGNIGVTTSQQMLESEMLLRQKWQLIKIITDMFMNDLTIPVYE